MKWHRIYGMLLRHLYAFRRSVDQMTDAFYWPTIDLLLWGLTGTYVMNITQGSTPLVMILVSGIVFWLIVWRGQYEITIGALAELWNKNLINIFTTPLKFSEWLVSLFFLAIGKAIMSFMVGAGLAALLYSLNIFEYGFHLIPFIFILMMNGWWVALFVAGIILRYGSKVQALAWTTVHVLAPFLGIYYPISILPEWAQMISHAIPAMYVFEGGRELLSTGMLNWNSLWFGFGLNIIYLILGVWYIRSSFNSVLNKGLVKVY